MLEEAGVAPTPWKGWAPGHALPREGSSSRPSEDTGPGRFSSCSGKGNACLSHLFLFYVDLINLGPRYPTLGLLTSDTGESMEQGFSHFERVPHLTLVKEIPSKSGLGPEHPHFSSGPRWWPHSGSPHHTLSSKVLNFGARHTGVCSHTLPLCLQYLWKPYWISFMGMGRGFCL